MSRRLVLRALVQADDEEALVAELKSIIRDIAIDGAWGSRSASPSGNYRFDIEQAGS